MKRRNDRRRRVAHMRKIARICNELRLMIANYRKLIFDEQVVVHAQYLAEYDEFDVTTVFKNDNGLIKGWRNEGFDPYEAENPNLCRSYFTRLN